MKIYVSVKGCVCVGAYTSIKAACKSVGFSYSNTCLQVSNKGFHAMRGCSVSEVTIEKIKGRKGRF